MAAPARIRRSLFDRLLDVPGNVPEGLLQTCTVEQMRDAVARDLESLLNTRAALNFDDDALGPHVSRSVLCFGVRDFVGRVLTSSEDRRHIARSLSHAIETHEPRLQNVSVSFHDDQLSMSALAFTIRAVLVVRPAREMVSFDAVLQPASSSYRVTQARFAFS
ncbi:MAG: type VI secretion system baseplate subunit TssE [Aquabacterium sp.]